MVTRLRSHRMVLLVAFDGLAWLVALLAVALLFDVSGFGRDHGLRNAALLGLVCGSAHVLIGLLFRLHQGRAAVASFEDVVLVSTVAAAVGSLLVGANLAYGAVSDHGYLIRMLVAGLSPVLALVLMLWGRAVYRIQRDRVLSRPGQSGRRRPVVIVGAGEAAHQLISSMARDPQGAWLPVALVDDDRLKRHRRIRGVPVLGQVTDVAEVAHRAQATHVILAIPSAPPSLVATLETLVRREGLRFKVLPGTDDLENPSRASISDVRDIDVSDVLGRRQVDTDVESIAEYLAGKRVLVTGAGGSIGSELCRQIAKFAPAELIMLDRDESALHTVELSIHGRAMLDTNETVLGDIRDAHLMNSLFEQRRPHVVFHAAALKHLPLLEKAPGEAVKTNVWGTLAILEAAQQSGVERFVNISTDKAADPTSVLGYSKRLAEGLTSAFAAEAAGTYLSVRFGNVLGSRGSVLTAFAAQIAAGGPVTVTDRRVTRFFMTIREAVQLVIQAGAIGSDGEVLVLDMGEPVKIDAVARRLIAMSEKEIEVVYTGLRPGEKLHEDLLGEGEVDERPRHPMITHAPVPLYGPTAARMLEVEQDPQTLRDHLQRACGDLLTSTTARHTCAAVDDLD